MRKLEEKSSLAGRREERAAQRGPRPRPGLCHPWPRFLLTQDLHTLVAYAISGVLAPVDAEKQQAQD